MQDLDVEDGRWKVGKRKKGMEWNGKRKTQRNKASKENDRVKRTSVNFGYLAVPVDRVFVDGEEDDDDERAL